MLPIILTLLLSASAEGQDSTTVQRILSFPDKFTFSLNSRMEKLEAKMIAKSQKVLSQFKKQEEKIYRKLHSKDSVLAKAQLEEIRQQYTTLEQKLKSPTTSTLASNVKQYVPRLDSLKTALSFINTTGKAPEKLKVALSSVQSVETRLQQAEEIKQFLRQRRQQLKEQLERFGMVKQLKKYNKKLYYYADLVKSYKETLNDPAKLEQKTIELLFKLPAFQKFFREHSMVASLFRMPADPNDPAAIASLSNLQTRAQVQNLIQSQYGTSLSPNPVGGPAGNFAQQGMQNAQSQLQQLQGRVSQAGGGSSDFEIPDFKPNTEKNRSFLKRFQIGTNFQTVKHNGLFPVQSDIGLSLGYKLNSKSIAGIGSSFKMGWGQSFRNIQVSAQGLSLRSFLDWKIKGGFYASGGYEQNMFTEVRSLQQLRDYSIWKSSALVGVSKKYKLGKKRGGEMKLLYDFFYQRAQPRTQPLLLRFGYTF